MVGIVASGGEGIAAKATSAEAGRYVRRLSALLEEGVRVASQARVAARKQYDIRQGLRQARVGGPS